jgi:inner membrane protein involved in colicin E2 resistance
MNAYSHRTWIPFYLISFGTLSMAILRSMDGPVLIGSLVLVSGALAVIFLTIQAEVSRNSEKKELMEALEKKIRAAGDSGDSGAK